MSRPHCRVCLILPCFNEAHRLDLQQFRDFLDTAESTRILFVDDGSTDRTVSVLEEICRGKEDGAGILANPRNLGKAEAVRLGILHALDRFDPEMIGYWDADLATPLDTVARFVYVLDNQPGLEMIFGSRVKLLGRHIERRPMRHYLGRIFATVVSEMLRLPIYDTQCGAKLFRVSRSTGRVYAEPFLSKWVFDVEIIARYLKLFGGRTEELEKVIYEYPLETWIDIEGSKVRPQDFITALADIARIKRKYL
jgi:glycosyltransferase involved in cell wall biosynthesis